MSKAASTKRTPTVSKDYTPGPWKFDGNCAGYIDATIGDESVHIARAYSFADAHLMAASPDLLAAAEALANMYASIWDRVDGALVLMPGSIDRFEAAQENVRKAIQKARGE